MKIKGKIIRNTDAGFNEAVMETLFNKRPLDRKPFMLVKPESVEDIIEIIKFARENGKKISVFSGGHSWSANHVRDDAVIIDLGNFNRYEINKDSMTATAEPAVGGSDLLIELFKKDLFFPAG
nr:FAD-dependent oxidoreductase [Pyrinomonadaceae bacterium]